MNDIVVGVDQSATARKAAEAAAELAAACGTNLHIVMCVKGGSGKAVGVGGDQWVIDPYTEAENFLRELGRQLGHDQVTHSISSSDPAEAMCEEATRLGARMIVVGNRRVQGVSRVLGSIAHDVAKVAPCDVLIANTTA
jgi:nucleotide-binding universal stress UspA family protein